MSVIEVLREILGSELRLKDAAKIDPDLPLLQSGIIDSIELLQVVSLLESRFSICVDDTEVLPANFRSLKAIERYIQRKRFEVKAPVR